MKLNIAAIQNTATRDIPANIAWLRERVEHVVSNGAEVVCTPETCNLIEPDNSRVFDSTYSEADDPALAMFREAARELNVTIAVGSLAIRNDVDRVVNRAFYIDPDGEVVARYDKLHMFDIQLKNGEFYRESESFNAGDKAVVVDSPWCRIGLSICYDLRFAALYRALAQAGAKVLTIPAAFTQTTGQAHWHILVRARAIETGSFVVAANQCGTHLGRRQSFGHSLIVTPWGEVLADGGAEPGIVQAELDLDKVDEARQMIPAITAGKDFDLQEFQAGVPSFPAAASS
ncbi:MAG: carbon-nitrogen hydrolase family protein [Pseudomonadota bacterium]